MDLANRSLVTMDDLSDQEIEAVFSLADEMSRSRNEQRYMCQGNIMASLFFEPSTRTRLSFETAMLRLGGSVITAADVHSTSLAKGESIADMARIVGSYADIIVIRHPWEGAAKVVADYAGIPVINAGDGGHEHPSQTLCDLYTIKRERKTIQGLKIALWGDLKYGRTIHSLTCALARFGATIHFRPGPGLELPDYVVTKLTTEYGGQLQRCEAQNNGTKERLFPLDAIYVTPSSPHQLTMMPDINIQIVLKDRVDAIYMTRLQKERLTPTAEGQLLKKDYPSVDKKLLKAKEFEKTLVMHPLPRVDELAYEVDADPRSMYFKQAALGVPIRMALLALLLGAKKVNFPDEKEPTRALGRNYPVYNRDFGVRCHNKDCVSVQETEKRYIKPKFKIVAKQPLTLRCAYCEHETHPQYIASSEQDKKYHSTSSFVLGKIKPEHLIIFDSEKEASGRGFSPSRYVHVRADKG